MQHGKASRRVTPHRHFHYFEVKWAIPKVILNRIVWSSVTPPNEVANRENTDCEIQVIRPNRLVIVNVDVNAACLDKPF